MEDILTLAVRFFGYLIYEIVLGTIFYFIGWPFVKLATFGKYPKSGWLSGSKEEAYVCCVGLVVFVLFVMAILGQIGI